MSLIYLYDTRNAADELIQYVDHSLSVKDVPGNYDALYVPGTVTTDYT